MRDNNSLARALALATQLGFAVACPMVVFIAGGAWLGTRLGWMPWLLLLGVLLGVLSAGAALYQLISVQDRQSKRRGTVRAPYKVEQRSEDTGTDNLPADKPKHNGR